MNPQPVTKRITCLGLNSTVKVHHFSAAVEKRLSSSNIPNQSTSAAIQV